MSVGELIHSNLCLLGYERQASGSKIILSDETFEHANERAFQSVVHFLLHTLDEERCRQTFRHCWPVLDKRQSSVYRQAVVAWLKEIKQKDPDAARLPLINPALFLSPGGRKFKDLMLALTQFVMLKTIINLERELPDCETILHRGDGDVQCGTLRAACALGKERFVQLQKRKLAAHSHHQRFADSFSASYRRLRQALSGLTAELGRLVSASGLPPELTHRLLQEPADQVVPAVYGAAGQHVSALLAGLDRLRQFCQEAAYSWQVADSIVSGAVAQSVVDAQTLAVRPVDGPERQTDPPLLVEGKLDLLAFFDTFVARAEHLRQFLAHCPLGELKGLHGSLAPLVRESSQVAADAGRLLAELQAEADAAGRHVDRLLALDVPPGRPQPPASPSPPPLLAPRTPNWSLSAAPTAPPGDHPLTHMYRTPSTDGAGDKDKTFLDQSTNGELSSSDRFSSSVTASDSGRSSTAAAGLGDVSRHLPSVLTPSSAAGPARPAAASPAGPAAAGPTQAVSGGGRSETSTLTLSAATSDRSAAGGGGGGGRLDSCSSLFSPLAGRGSSAEWAPSSPSLGSVSSLTESAAESARPAAAGGGSPSAELVRLRQRTSVLLRHLTRSPAAAAGTERARPDTPPAVPGPPRGPGTSPTVPGPARGPDTPAAVPGSPRGQKTPPAEQPVSRRRLSSGGDPAADRSRQEDQMAEALAMSVFGSTDFNHSLDFSLNRDSLGGVELQLVPSDDSDYAPGPDWADPPTDILIDI